jgi:hypothetical protein
MAVIWHIACGKNPTTLGAPSKHGGICSICGLSIDAGQRISWQRRFKGQAPKEPKRRQDKLDTINMVVSLVMPELLAKLEARLNERLDIDLLAEEVAKYMLASQDLTKWVGSLEEKEAVK